MEKIVGLSQGLGNGCIYKSLIDPYKQIVWLMNGTLEIQVLVILISMLLLLVYLFVGEYGWIVKAEKVKDKGPHDDHCQCCDENAMCYPCFALMPLFIWITSKTLGFRYDRYLL